MATPLLDLIDACLHDLDYKHQFAIKFPNHLKQGIKSNVFVNFCIQVIGDIQRNEQNFIEPIPVKPAAQFVSGVMQFCNTSGIHLCSWFQTFSYSCKIRH
jgi:hypothetical protein